MSHEVRVLCIEQLNDRVYRYVTEKPEGYEFKPGQATEVAIDKEGWRDEKRPFTFTSLPINPRLEFTIKSYPSHDGVTEQLEDNIQVGDKLIIEDPWGAIQYQGPGVFLAGGAGVTPFISILRQAEHDNVIDGNRLFFSNKKVENVFLQADLFRMLGRSVVFTLTDQEHRDYEHGRIDREWLESRVDSFDQPFYVCGPPKMVEELQATLEDLGVKKDQIVVEES